MKTKTFIVLLIVIVALVGMTACKKSKQENLDLRKVRVLLDWTPNTNHTGLYVAKELGYFKEQGLDVEIIQPSQNSTESLVANGNAEFGVSYQESVTIASSKSIPIKSIAAIIQHNTSGFASLRKDNIRSVAEFAGKRYGSSGWPSELEILRQVMNSANASYDSVQVVSGVYDFFSTIGKDADIEWIFYGWDGVQAKRKGIEINYLPIREIDPIFDFYTPVIITNEKLMLQEPETVRSFLAAVSKGYEYCIVNPVKAADVLLKSAPELDKEHVLASLEYLKNEFKSDATQWGIQKPEVWQRFSDWMYQKRIIGIGVKASDAFTNEFLP